MPLTGTAFLAANWADWTVDQRINWIKWASPTHTISPAQEDAIIREWATQHYGALAAYLQLPAVGAILKRAAREGWTDAKLQMAVSETYWWKHMSASQREWDALSFTDPQTARARTSEMVTKMRTLLEQEGVSDQFTDDRVQTLAITALRNGAGDDDLPRMILAEAQFAPTQPVGRLGARMTQVQSLRDQYLVPLSQETAFAWAKNIETGAATEEGLQEYVRQLAKGQWDFLGDRIDAGMTVRQLLNPQIQIASQDWGVDPSAISAEDLTNLSTIVDPAEGKVRQRNLNETRQAVRSDDRFWVDNPIGEAEAARAVTGLAQQLGMG